VNKGISKVLLKDKALVDKELIKLFKTSNQYEKPLYERMYYSLSAGGKRIRPSIILNVGRMVAGDDSTSLFLPAACSVEMIHTYSLIHDDLPSMDNDDFRRGIPTLHKKYNESSAVLAGDALFSYAIETFLSSNFKSKNVLNALTFLLKSIGPQGMVAGQFVDTEISLYLRNLTTLNYIHHKKTANLISACFAIPTLLIGKSKALSDEFAELGKSMGLLFQIIDDILDIKSDSSTLGKTAGKDIEQNKLTYITFFGQEKAMVIMRKEADSIRKQMKDMKIKNIYLENLLEYFITRIN